MKITILTLFPEMFQGPFDHSIIKRAKEKGLVEIEFVNIRDFGIGQHKMVDDTAYGGGVGMVMKVDVLYDAIQYAKQNADRHSGEERSSDSKISNHSDAGQASMTKVILLGATGKTFKQQTAIEFSQLDHLILICGHYEGVDERVKEYIDEEISIGDFVLTGGEIPAMLIADAVSRLIPGVLPEGATEDESFSIPHNDTIVVTQNFVSLLEYPHYTKPQEFKGQEVPEVLLSGNHKKIEEWRHEQALERTKKLRPDLLK